MRAILALLVAAGLAGCSAAPPPKQDPGTGPNDRLRATLVSPTDIRLDWKDAEPAAAGRVVEFATEPDGQYTILQFVPPPDHVHPPGPDPGNPVLLPCTAVVRPCLTPDQGRVAASVQ
jgi:hypothetical protein